MVTGYATRDYVVYDLVEYDVDRTVIPMSAGWLPTLITTSPEEGYQLALTLSRKAVAFTQPDAEVRSELRPVYAHDASSLIAVSQVVATNFQTIAAANDHWKETDR